LVVPKGGSLSGGDLLAEKFLAEGEDIRWRDGEDLRREPLEGRKAR